jgi:excinuclease ABC subunit A
MTAGEACHLAAPADSEGMVNGDDQPVGEQHVGHVRPVLGPSIQVRGAREHNLKNVDVDIPRDALVVITGLSGSGKSTLAFDTVYAEGQRRYVESLSSYARQFLGQMDKPDVDSVDGLSPAIAIDQKSGSQNPRSTVGTVTEIWDYMRLLWSRTGHAYCTNCSNHEPLQARTADQIADTVLAAQPGSLVMVLAPIVRGRKGAHAAEFAALAAAGFARVKVDGTVARIEDVGTLEPKRRHDIDVVIDRIRVEAPQRGRLVEAVETAVGRGDGLVSFDTGGETVTYSARMACPECGSGFPALEPRMFSFNSPHGACEHCSGLGSVFDVDLDAAVPDTSKTLREGAIAPWNTSMSGGWARMVLTRLASRTGFDLDTSWEALDGDVRTLIVEGVSGRFDATVTDRHGRAHELTMQFEGLRSWLLRRHAESGDQGRERLARYLREVACPLCSGSRLGPFPRAVTVGGATIVDVAAMHIDRAREFFETVQLDERQTKIAERVLKEINERLRFLNDVGLKYLSLNRSARTLSGGETQRIRLASQVGSGLVGVLYVLDEPSIGLHQRDNDQLLATLTRLRDLGNTVLVVEHDEDTIRAADWVIDIGPGAGETGGRVVAAGLADHVARCSESLTGQYLSGRLTIAVPGKRRTGSGEVLTVRGAAANNLRNVDVSFPLGTLTCVTGVSGSGKSSLVTEVLEPALARHLHGAHRQAGAHVQVDGLEHVDKVVAIDQGPIGRTPRSNPATYTGVFDKIRQLYATTPVARRHGWTPGRFSFNVAAANGGGRCEGCSGEGQVRIEMHFLPDVWVPCEVCAGKRYGTETLTATFKDSSIADVLDMPVSEACAFFEAQPAIGRQLVTLRDVGLGYLRLGQPATTLSGGEAQRVKLASELQRRATGRTVYVLDEPTTGLHFHDVSALIAVLDRLVDGGNTVVVIEHNLDVIKRADWIVDLGPEGGSGGGKVVATGTPEKVAKVKASHTGRYLAPVLQRSSSTAPKRK